ncbi:patatin-like phospholipase family protein [Chryseobacterium sp. RP-3-3]|uniref:Patatin-like phospholipase family protein n=1 Tax=Chryseobacterium antibioticum TaxID=2728847 RepID=A0A7Y0FTN8_9FLAO|nr:patatin-like phospholipase family protein [Chryseobacterium antibioticum]NML72015.1 patatin-like phospholipase family protein [Chryseobacterium antibioticum]
MKEKFKRAVLFSGGGTRLMIYLGMFAALEELDMKPDILIASCGGAFAANVINAFPDNNSRKKYLKSEEYFRFVSGTVLTMHKKLTQIGLFSFKKILDKRSAPFIEDVFGRYLVEMPQDLSEVFPSLKNIQFSKEIPTVIIGSEILFDPKEAGQERNGRKLYRKIILTDQKTAEKIDPEKIIIGTENFTNSAVEKLPVIKTDIPLLESTRISVSDMFYVKPVYLQGKYFAGGAIDLIPAELAHHLADEIIIEKKQAYSSVEEAFVRAVLGFSGNERLLEIEKLSVDFQIDTTDIKQDLEGHYLKKGINWGKFEIDFSFPKTYEQFAKDMEMQWQYGYDQTMKSIRG